MRYGCQDISIFKGGYNFYQQQWTCMPLLLVNWSGIFHDALFVGIFEGKSDGMEKVVCCKVFQGNTKQQFLRCSFLMASFFMVTRRWCAHHSSCATSVSQWIMLLCYDNDATLIHTGLFSPKRLIINLIQWYSSWNGFKTLCASALIRSKSKQKWIVIFHSRSRNLNEKAIKYDQQRNCCPVFPAKTLQNPTFSLQ